MNPYPLPHTLRVGLLGIADAVRAAGGRIAHVNELDARPPNVRGWSGTVKKLIDLGLCARPGEVEVTWRTRVGVTAAGWSATASGVLGVVECMAAAAVPVLPAQPVAPAVWQAAAAEYRRFLGGIEAMAVSAGHEHKAGMRWHSVMGFVAKLGVAFRPPPGPLPAWLRRGIPQYCYANCHHAAKRARGRVLYAEGYSLFKACPIPIAHAWLVDAADPWVIYEITAGEPADVYVGLAFTEEFRRRSVSGRRESVVLIDDWENGWPLLKMSDEELLAATVRIPEGGAE